MNFIDGIRHLYLFGLNDIASIPPLGIKYWLGKTDNIIPHIYESAHFDIVFYDINEILSHYASDINRVSCASLETIFRMGSISNEKSIGWDLIQYYYSGFYSAHSIMKILGFGLVNLDDYAIRNIERRFFACNGFHKTLSRGVYCFHVDHNKKTASFYKNPKYDDSHKGAWTRFSDLLQVLTGKLVVEEKDNMNCVRVRNRDEPFPLSIYHQLPQNDAQVLIERIESLLKVMNLYGNYNYFSSIRNKINYAHSYGVWYPYKLYNRQYDRISTMKDFCFKQPLDSVFASREEIELIYFVKYLQFINCINFSILDDLLTRNSNNKSFLKNNFISFKNKYIRNYI